MRDIRSTECVLFLIWISYAITDVQHFQIWCSHLRYEIHHILQSIFSFTGPLTLCTAAHTWTRKQIWLETPTLREVDQLFLTLGGSIYVNLGTAQTQVLRCSQTESDECWKLNAECLMLPTDTVKKGWLNRPWLMTEQGKPPFLLTLWANANCG